MIVLLNVKPPPKYKAPPRFLKLRSKYRRGGADIWGGGLTLRKCGQNPFGRVRFFFRLSLGTPIPTNPFRTFVAYQRGWGVWLRSTVIGPAHQTPTDPSPSLFPFGTIPTRKKITRVECVPHPINYHPTSNRRRGGAGGGGGGPGAPGPVGPHRPVAVPVLGPGPDAVWVTILIGESPSHGLIH